MTTPRAYRRQAEAADDKCAALEAQLAEAQAQAAQMREALEMLLRSALHYTPYAAAHEIEQAEAALAAAKEKP